MPFQLQLVLEVLLTLVAEVDRSKNHIMNVLLEADVIVEMRQDIGLLLYHTYGQLEHLFGQHVDSE